MNDIVTFLTSLQEHLVNLKLIVQIFRECNIKVQINKCEFRQKEVVFLGHVVSPEGVKSNLKKIRVIQVPRKFELCKPVPKNEKELGMIGY